jgi:hypothetical protein
LNSVYMTLIWSFNPQLESLDIHLSHELHDTTRSLRKPQVVTIIIEWMICVVSGLLIVLYFYDVDD